LPTGDDSAHLRARRCAAKRRVSLPSPKCASRSASRGGKARRVFNGLGAQSASSGAAMDVLARACTPSGRRVHADMHQRPATDVPLTLACDVNAASVGRAEDPVCNIRRSCVHLHAVINYGSTGLPGYLEHLHQKRAVWRRLQTGPAVCDCPRAKPHEFYLTWATRSRAHHGAGGRERLDKFKRC
jgi:hypothetical protein